MRAKTNSAQKSGPSEDPSHMFLNLSDGENISDQSLKSNVSALTKLAFDKADQAMHFKKDQNEHVKTVSDYFSSKIENGLEVAPD